MADETELEIAQAAHDRVLAELEEVRAEHATAIKALQEEIDALKEERKATVIEMGERIRALQDEGSRVYLEEKVTHDAELRAKGKTIARMKGEIREMRDALDKIASDWDDMMAGKSSPRDLCPIRHGYEPPLEDDIPVEPVPGEIEPEETE